MFEQLIQSAQYGRIVLLLREISLRREFVARARSVLGALDRLCDPALTPTGLDKLASDGNNPRAVSTVPRIAVIECLQPCMLPIRGKQYRSDPRALTIISSGKLGIPHRRGSFMLA